MEGGDAGVVEGGEDAGFLPQAREALGLARELLGQRLEGDLAVQLRVAGAVHLAHAPGAEPGHDLVGAHAGSGWSMMARLKDVGRDYRRPRADRLLEEERPSVQCDLCFEDRLRVGQTRSNSSRCCSTNR